MRVKKQAGSVRFWQSIVSRFTLSLVMATSASAQQDAKTTQPIVEVDKIEVGELPESVAREIERLEKLAASETDSARKLAIEDRIRGTRERAERATTTYIFARFPNGVPADRNFYQYPVQIELRTSLAADIEVGDFIEVSLPEPNHGMWISNEKLSYPDIQRLWRNLRVREVSRPEWWPQSREAYYPDYLTPDETLTKESGLHIAGAAEAPYERTQDWYQHTMIVENGGDRTIRLAQFVVQLFDESGDQLVVAPQGIGYTDRSTVQMLSPGERTNIVVQVPTYLQLRFDSARLVCVFVQYEK